ncbi:MAG: iron/manganese transporter [Chitinophagaceae bacterium]|nr:MAG: iron/manganese transporter [Chitinophagaceae bacterium]
MSNIHPDKSLGEVHESVDTTRPNRSALRKVMAFMGPAYLVSVGYMDPGNWATDLAGGSQFGYSLIWVLLMSNLMALLLQSLSARLGIVRRRDLAQANRETYPKPVNFALYLLAEVAIAATDLAEVLGMAIGLQLLTGLPLIWGVLITVLDTFLLLLLQKLGMRKMEAFIIVLVFIIGCSFLIEIILAKPDLSEVVKGFVPSLPADKVMHDKALFIAIGIIGATVMPHNLYLHSALVQSRKIKRDEAGIRRAIRLNFLDTTIALNLAFLVNAAILILAAAVFFTSGRTEVAEIKDAHHLLDSLLGTSLAPALFAIALIAAGQSSTVTGTLAGQIVMEGYLRIRINPWMRRLLTRVIAIVPAVIVILINGEEDIDQLLIFSQVVLSLQLGFAIIPLIHFVSDKKTMGTFVIKPVVQVAAWVVTAVLVYLNLSMVGGQAADFFREPGNTWWKILAVLAGISFIGLLVITIVYPLLKKRWASRHAQLHTEPADLGTLAVPAHKRIAVALDFSANDSKILAYAMGQGSADASYVLIHIVESVSARVFEHDSDDLETQKDREHLLNYEKQLKAKGIRAEARLGFGDRAKQIVQVVTETNADMLVIGAHGHSGIRDLIYGQTINTVRHELKIPVLVVNVNAPV